DFPYFLSLYADPDASLPKGVQIQTNFGSPFAFAPFRLFAAVADFTGDGYDDVAYVGLTANTGGNLLPDAIVVSAVNPDNPSLGLRFGSESDFDFPSVIPQSVAAGDFMGNGQFSLAIVGMNSQ